MDRPGGLSVTESKFKVGDILYTYKTEEGAEAARAVGAEDPCPLWRAIQILDERLHAAQTVATSATTRASDAAHSRAEAARREALAAADRWELRARRLGWTEGADD
jgi:hypothetical protein